MDFLSCFTCCGKRTNPNNKDQSILNEGPPPLQAEVFTIFADFESKLTDLKSIEAHEFIKEAKLLASYNSTISTRQLSLLYTKFSFQFTSLITFFSQEFFFTNDLGTEYDALKVYIFNLLYCSGDDKTKLLLLYDILTNHGEELPKKINDEKFIQKLELLIMIPTFLIANIVE